MEKVVEKYLSSAYTVVKVIKESKKNEILLVINNVSQQLCIIKYIYSSGTVYEDLKQINSKFFPEIFNVINQENRITVIEEYISGNTLDEVLVKQGRLSDTEIEGILIQLCEAMSILHKNNFIHRDIKLSNIMLTSAGILKIIDFDTARKVKADVCFDTEYLGTRGYAPPEQYGFKQTDIRSDIYALGITLKKLNPQSSKLIKIAEKASQFDPDKRFQNVDEILKEIQKNPCRNRIIAFLAVMSLLISLGISIEMHENTIPKQLDNIYREDAENNQKIFPVNELPPHDQNNDGSVEIDNSETSKPIAKEEKNSSVIVEKNDRSVATIDTKNKSKQEDLFDQSDIEHIKKSLTATYNVSGITNAGSIQVISSGDIRIGQGLLKILIRNDNKFSVSGGIDIMIWGMYLRKDAFNWNMPANVRIYDGKGANKTYYITQLSLDLENHFLPESVFEITVDLSKGTCPEADSYWSEHHNNAIRIAVDVGGYGHRMIDQKLNVVEL